MRQFAILSLAAIAATACAPDYDVIIRHGTVYDGTGSAPVVADVAIKGDTIAAVGDLGDARGRTEVDATGMAVAPGFINMLSWATESLIEDGRSQGDIRQGVTLEVMGEGWSMGPVNEQMKQDAVEEQADITYDIAWTTLGEYLDYLEHRGVSTNVGSFLGATTVRIHEIGYADRPPTAEELDRMKALVRQAMEAGAFGLATALIYPPGFYASTEELIELATIAAEYDGLYISHMRSEGNQLLEAFDEFLSIVRGASIRGEIYHLKAAGQSNWEKMDEVIRRVEQARAEGLAVGADMYTYTAGATGLTAAFPPWSQDGGHDALIERLKDPATRARIAVEMRTPTDEWENLFLAAGSPDRVLLVGFKNPELKSLTGKTLAEVAAMRGTSVEETAMDLVIEDDSRVGTVFFMMSEDNVKKQVALPWVSFGSDAESQAPEGVFLQSNPHPRAYGNFARLIGKYVREEQVVPLEDAIRRLTSLPASNLRIQRRGTLASGYFADVVVFDPAAFIDHATFAEPQQYATGMLHVFVNGVQVLENGEHTGATPGRVIRGPGWRERAADVQ
jgi:N-acyl-D-amino-acid deacylase